MDETKPSFSKDPMVRMTELLGYRFEDHKLLLQALTHRSYVNECSEPGVLDNERFEFLGDAVLDLIVSVELMKRYPEAREGTLSKFRASIVSEGALSALARKIRLGEALRLGRGEERSGGREKPSILADAFEAVVAAVYQEAGLSRIAAVLLPHLAFPKSAQISKEDAKTELQQRIQAERRITPSYRMLEEHGPDHDKTFVVELLVGEEVFAQGQGRTKKEAEQAAAAKMLQSLDA